MNIELAEVAALYGLKASDLMTKTPAKRISHPRQHAMTVLRARGWSYPKIAAHFGMDHTSVIYGVREHKRRAAR